VIERSGCRYLRGQGPDAATDVLRDPAIALEERRRLGRRAGIPERQLDGWVDNLLDGDCAHPRPVAERLLGDGDRIASALGEWGVIAASGHNPTQIVLHNSERGWLLGADLAFRGAGPYLECGWTEDPYAEHLTALERCARLPLTLLLAGHGRPAPSPAALLREAHALTERFGQRVLDALGGGLRTPYEVAAALLDPADTVETCQATLSTVVCVLEHLERRGALAAAIDAHGARRYRPAVAVAAG